MSFLRKLSVFFSNELERNLHFLLDNDQDAYLQEENYYKFLEFLSEKIPRFSKSTSINSFLRSSQKQTAWPGALRHLMVMHKLIHDVGEDCYPWLSTDSMRHFNKFKGHDNSLKTFVYKAMVSYYYNYLTKLSYNYDDYSVCFHIDSHFQNKLFENGVSPLSSLSKLQNILRYLIHIFSLFEASIVKLTPCLLVKQTTYFCLTDCYHFYTYINQVITTLMKEFFTLPTQEAIFLYELYSEHLIITRKIQAYYETLQTELSEFSLLIPKFFNFDPVHNTKVELYIRTLRSNRPKLLKAQTLPASKFNNPNDESFTSVKDMSRIIADCINKNNSDTIYRKIIFEAPRGLPKKKGSRRIFPQPTGGKMLSTMPTQIGTKLVGDKSIEVQNTCISNQFEPGQFVSNSQQQLGQSHYPLTAMNQSFLPDENAGDMLSISANNSILQVQRVDHGVLF